MITNFFFLKAFNLKNVDEGKTLKNEEIKEPSLLNLKRAASTDGK